MSLFNPFQNDDSENDESTDTERATVEGEYDPTVPKRINSKEWWIERIDGVSGELETYAGAWPRAMIENAEYEPEQPVWMGCSERTGREFGVKFSRSFRHIAYLGSTGTGKTTAIYNSVTQLMMGGHGVAIVDPKGDDVYDLLRRVPKHRWDDVIYVDLGADYFALEDEETGEKIPYQIGFNILDTYHEPGEPGFDEEVEWIVADLIELLAAGEYWGPRMDRIAKNMIRGMARHEEEFTIIEIYYALLEEDNRKQYADLIGDSIDDDDIMFLEAFTRRIADELDDNELDPLLGRLKDWVENPITRKIIAMRGAEVTLGQIVNEQKILIVNNDLPKEAKVMTANAVVSGIWTAVTSRKDPSEQRMMELAGIDDVGSEYKPFFLAIDECHSVLTDGDEIETMLMEARSKKLGLMLSTQVLRSLPDDAADAIISNCNTILSLTPNHPEEAREIANRFGGMDVEDLQRTPDYHAQTQLNSEDEPFLAKLLPPYPPRHSIEDAYELILKSLENYGSPVQSGREILDEMHFDAGIEALASGDPEQAEEADDEHKRQIIKAVYDSAIATDQPDGDKWTSIDPVLDRLTEQWDLSRERASHTIETMTTVGYLRTKREDDALLLRPTPDALELLGLDTGKGQTGGGAEHRTWLLPRAYETLTKAGYDVQLPEQGEGDGELPDGLADPRMDLSSTSLSEAEQKRERLEAEYPIVADLSDGETLIVEAESQGTTKPAGPLKNLSKADSPVLFVVAEEGDNGTKKAQALANIIQDPPFTSSRCPSDADAKLYTRNDLPVQEGGDDRDTKSGDWFAVAPQHVASVEWVRYGERITLRDRESKNTLVEFDDAQAYAAREKSDFPVRYAYDSDSKVYVVVDTTGPEMDKRKYSTEKALRAQETTVKEPTVPELAFPDGVEHGEDWYVAIVPNDESQGLQLFDPETDATRPLLDDITEYDMQDAPESTDEQDDETDAEEGLTLEERLRRLEED